MWKRAVMRVLAVGVLLLVATAARWFYDERWRYRGYVPRPFTPAAWAAADAEGRGPAERGSPVGP